MLFGTTRPEHKFGKTRFCAIRGKTLYSVRRQQQKSDLSWRPETYSPHGDELVKTIRELAPGAEIVVQETWSYAPWDKRLASWNITSDEMYSRLRAAYGAFAGRYGFRTIPMGLAVQEWRKRLPVIYSDKSFGGDVVGGRNQPPSEQFVERGGKWMPNSDLYHLNGKGEYLQALVWTAFLFDADVTGCSFVPPEIDAGEAKLMQRIAVDVVSNRLREEDRAVLFAGLESVLPQAHLDAIWSILWQRWNYWRTIGGGDR